MERLFRGVAGELGNSKKPYRGGFSVVGIMAMQSW